MRFQSLLVCTLIAIGSGAILAQRGGGGTNPATGVITGVVVADDIAKTVVRRATVTLTGGGIPSSLVTTSDDDGRFTFSGIPAGEYRLQCAKVAFVRSYYGAKTSYRGPGLPILVADGGRASLTMVLTRGAVIAGTVLNDAGRPAETTVQIFEFQTIDGVRRLRNVAVPNEMTDDQGRFRAFGLPPGEYLVGAIGRPGAWNESAEASTQSRPVMYAPMYYPGTLDPAAATLIRVEPGEERNGISFHIRTARTATVEGTIMDEQAQPVDGVQVRALFRAEQPGEFASQILARTSITSNGRFSLSGLPPSQYVIVAQRSSPAQDGRPASLQWSTQDIELAGRDLDGVNLTLRPGRTVSGRIAVDGASSPADLSAVKVGLQSSQDNPIRVIIAPTAVSPDGTFSIAGVVPGRYRIQITPPSIGSPQAFVLHSAAIRGRDGIDAPFEVDDSTDLNDIVVKFSASVTSLAGSVTGSETIPAQALSIVVFSTDRAFWMTNSRRVRASHPATTGGYAFSGLPAGEYFITAVLDFVPADLTDSRFLDSLSKSAFKIALADGEKKNLALAVK